MTKQEVLGMCMRNARKEMRISAEQVAEKLGKTKQGIEYFFSHFVSF